MERREEETQEVDWPYWGLALGRGQCSLKKRREEERVVRIEWVQGVGVGEG